MARIIVAILLCSLSATAQLVERSQPAPQTPRQALIEIFRSKDAAAIDRHLPEITRKKLREFGNDPAPGLAVLTSGELRNLSANDEGVEIFEAGPILLRWGNQHVNERMEVVIEGEDFRGDETHLELGFHFYKEEDEVTRWYMPRLLLHMKQEQGVWRVAELAFSAKLPLSDPDFLDAMVKEARERRNKAAESGVYSVIAAQVEYAETYPDVGYACTLASLGGMNEGRTKAEAGPTQAMLIPGDLASGRKEGYSFAISNCGGRPAARFTLTAVPEKRGPGSRAFCANESGRIRYSTDGRAESCLTNGRPLK